MHTALTLVNESLILNEYNMLVKARNVVFKQLASQQEISN